MGYDLPDEVSMPRHTRVMTLKEQSNSEYEVFVLILELQPT